MKNILCLASICAATAQHSFAWNAFDSGAGTSQNAAITHRGVLTGWLPRQMESSDYALSPGVPLSPETPVPKSDPPRLPALSISRTAS